MATQTALQITDFVRQAAARAGLIITTSNDSQDDKGAKTIRMMVARSDRPELSLPIEVHEQVAGFESSTPMQQSLESYLVELAQRMKNPIPNAFVTLEGFPVSFSDFGWPLHRSTSGSDAWVVHGIMKLEDGGMLHAKISASFTATLLPVLTALEQPYLEALAFNAIRKTLDQEQLEFLKSGNRQPVHVSTRFWSFRENRYIISETNEQQRLELLKSKTYWLSGVLGANKPVWLADPCDAMYTDSSVATLKQHAKALAEQGYVKLDATGEWATPTAKLMGEATAFQQRKDAALAALKPQFNEDMREGKTNM